MSLGDDIALALPDWRIQAASIMGDTATIRGPGAGDGTIDPATGNWTPPTGSVVYTGPCRVRPPTGQEQSMVFGDDEVTRTRYVVVIPYDAPPVTLGSVVTVDESDDPMLDARALRVTHVPMASYLIARKLGAEIVE